MKNTLKFEVNFFLTYAKHLKRKKYHNKKICNKCEYVILFIDQYVN